MPPAGLASHPAAGGPQPHTVALLVQQHAYDWLRVFHRASRGYVACLRRRSAVIPLAAAILLLAEGSVAAGTKHTSRTTSSVVAPSLANTTPTRAAGLHAARAPARARCPAAADVIRRCLRFSGAPRCRSPRSCATRSPCPARASPPWHQQRRRAPVLARGTPHGGRKCRQARRELSQVIARSARSMQRSKSLRRAQRPRLERSRPGTRAAACREGPVAATTHEGRRLQHARLLDLASRQHQPRASPIVRHGPWRQSRCEPAVRSAQARTYAARRPPNAHLYVVAECASIHVAYLRWARPSSDVVASSSSGRARLRHIAAPSRRYASRRGAPRAAAAVGRHRARAACMVRSALTALTASKQAPSFVTRLARCRLPCQRLTRGAAQAAASHAARVAGRVPVGVRAVRGALGIARRNHAAAGGGL